MSAPTPAPPRQERSQRTLDRILEGTLALLTERDLDALSAEEIARAARVSVGTLYTRFKSKDDILAFVLQSVQQAQVERLRTSLAPERWAGVGLAERVDWLVHQLESTASQRPALIRAVFSSLTARDAAAGPDIGARNAETVELLADWLFDSGEVTAPEPDTATRVAAAAISYTIHLALLYPFTFPGVSTKAVVTELRRMVLAGLTGARQASPSRAPDRSRPR